MALLMRRCQMCLAVLAIASIGLLAAPGVSSGADVDVYGEGAYTASDLVLYIYADINSGPILSFGVSVQYPSGLTFAGATKNGAVWFFGDGSAEHPYMDPQNTPPSGATPGSVVIIGGKLDTSAPTAGVTGDRVLLGTVTFNHSGVTDFSGVSLTYAHGDGTGTYKNFVGTDGSVKDGGGVGFAMKIRERGDANMDGIITNLDMFATRNLLGGDYVVFADCNADGVLTNLDMFCVRGKL